MAKLPRLGIITPSPRYIEQVTCLYGKPEKRVKVSKNTHCSHSTGWKF